MTPEQIIELYEELGSANKVAAKVGHRKLVQRVIRAAIAEGKVIKRGRCGPPPKSIDLSSLPEAKPIEPVFDADEEIDEPHWIRKAYGEDVNRYIFTSAQNNTKLHTEFWDNLTSLAQLYCADIFVTPFTYNKAKGGGSVIKDTMNPADFEEQNWDPMLHPYICREKLRITNDLLFIGDANIRPTILNPIPRRRLAVCGSGSGIFPAAQRRLDSLPRHPANTDKPRFAMTTGACTRRNYRKESAGDIAEEHHVIGAVLVEVDVATGDWWARHIEWSKETQAICDLDITVRGGVVHKGRRARSVVIGDLHEDESCPDTMYATFGPMLGNGNSLDNDNLMDRLRPANIVIHDALDFNRRSHHDRFRMEEKFINHHKGKVSVEQEINELAYFLDEASKRASVFDGEIYVVASNHNDALTRWLSITDTATGAPLTDEENLVFYLKANQRRFQDLYDQTQIGHAEPFHDVLKAQCEEVANMEGVTFLKRWDTLNLEGVEHSFHGDVGMNGTRGSTSQFTQLDSKVTKGHSHSPEIQEGVYTAGTSSKLRLGYNNNSPTKWANAHVVMYENGKRAIVVLGPRTKNLWADRRNLDT